MLRKKLLLITYHFPPSAASGAFRLLGFSQHLPTFGWQPLVVAPPRMPWEPLDPHLVQRISDDARVRYVPYPANAPKLARRLAQDAIWLPRAWSACQQMIAEHRPDIVLTSGPPHCVHALGYYLKRIAHLPWVADFRDPWITGSDYHKLGWAQRWALRWEHTVFANANLILANAPNATRMFESKYPLASDRILTLTNGFDPAGGDEFLPEVGQRNVSPSINLLHAGEIYGGRDPAPLFQALEQINTEMSVGRSLRLQILGRSAIALDNLLTKYRCKQFVSVLGQRNYRESLVEMSQADILVLLDSPGRTIGVPAKLYEYFRAGRPILALSEPNGDVATILRESTVLHRIVSLKDVSKVRAGLCELVEAMSTTPTVAMPEKLQQFTRECVTQKLVHQLETISRQPFAGSSLA